MNPIKIAEDAGAEDWVIEYLTEHYQITTALG